MTMQTHVPMRLPEPSYPMVTRVISNPLYPAEETQTVGCPHCKQAVSVTRPANKEEPITWVVSKAHPLIAGMKVMRMFVDEDSGDIKIFSVSDDSKVGMVNEVPSGQVRLIEKAMPLEVFVEELNFEEGEGEGGDAKTDGETPTAVANGQQSPS